MRRTSVLAAVLAGLVIAGGGVGVAAATVGAQEYTPTPVSGTSTQAPTRSTPATPATSGTIGEDVPAAPEQPVGGGTDCQTGPAQRAVEEYLAEAEIFGDVIVDGVQSAVDCAAIVKFQKRYGIQPAKGYAGPLSSRVVTRLATTDFDECEADDGLTVCVDLTAQTAWVERDGKRVLGPTTIRSGRAGLETVTGRLAIEEKKRSTVSSYFGVELPYWQQFHNDMGFHQTTSYLYDAGSPGSHGCINLLPADASRLYELTETGTAVHIFGSKPGT